MIRALTLVSLGALSFAGVYLWGEPRDDAPASPPVALSATAQPPAPAAPSTAAALAPAPAATTSAPAPSTPVILASAAPAQTPPEAEPPPASSPASGDARRERLFNPIFAGADTIKVGARTIHLAGIDAPSFETTCGEGAKAWPCGRMARSALQRFLRGRAIECEVPAGASEVPDAARCATGGEDIAGWLVAQGWAKRSGDLYTSEERRARDAAIGLWGADRPDRQALAATAD